MGWGRSCWRYIRKELRWDLRRIFIRNPNRMWLWLRNHTITRYHILDISNKENGWEYGYSDNRERMIYACFAILVDFVEGEIENVDWTWTLEHLKVRAEIDILYNWWKFERPNRVCHKGDFGWCSAEDKKYMARLMEVREWLWA